MPALRRCFNKDVRLALSNVRFWTPADYIQAQRIRARCNAHFRRVLSRVDVIATPTTPITAPPIHPTALAGGACRIQCSTLLSDLISLDLRPVYVSMRYMMV